MTSSLFATTVLASFFVVALPHILPCPAPRVAFADGEMAAGAGKPRRRRRAAAETPESKDGIIQFDGPSEEDGTTTSKRRSRRECPVPKPGGVVGELLGFKNGNEGEGRSKR